jgi:hypothetical protein
MVEGHWKPGVGAASSRKSTSEVTRPFRSFLAMPTNGRTSEARRLNIKEFSASASTAPERGSPGALLLALPEHNSADRSAIRPGNREVSVISRACNPTWTTGWTVPIAVRLAA